MKKTLLIAAAALAASVISSEAQVYSQNIVGYVNKPLPLGYSSVAVPLNAAGGNALTNTIPNNGALDGASLFIFNGVKFTTYTFDSTFPTGFGNDTDSVQAQPPVMDPGLGFYINNNTGVALTNTFVGTVAVNSLPGTTTNTFAAGKTFAGSILPISGGISSVMGFANTGGALDGTQVFVPNISGGGAIQGYTTSTFDSGFGTGFGNATDSAQAPEPTIPVASGFIYDNNAGLGPVVWTQTLTP